MKHSTFNRHSIICASQFSDIGKILKLFSKKARQFVAEPQYVNLLYGLRTTAENYQLMYFLNVVNISRQMEN